MSFAKFSQRVPVATKDPRKNRDTLGSPIGKIFTRHNGGEPQIFNSQTDTKNLMSIGRICSSRDEDGSCSYEREPEQTRSGSLLQASSQLSPKKEPYLTNVSLLSPLWQAVDDVPLATGPLPLPNVMRSQLLASREVYSPRRCSHCGTTDTPGWRRRVGGEMLCNACGLYERVNKSQRSFHLVNGAVRVRRRSSAVSDDRTCANCHTNRTPMWRRIEGTYYCNACAIYYRHNKRHRPVTAK